MSLTALFALLCAMFAFPLACLVTWLGEYARNRLTRI